MRKVLLALLAIVCLLSASSLALAADGKVYKLRMAGLYMDKHVVVQKVWMPFFEEVKKRTNGQVEITYFNPGTICPEPDHYESLKKGQIDIGSHIVFRNPGKLVPSTVTSNSTDATTASAGSLAFWQLYQASPLVRKDFEDIKILTVHSSAPAHFAMVSKQIKTLEDFDSKKVIVVGGDGNRMMRALGSQSIALPQTDFYLSLSRGMADGCSIPIAPMRSFKISEATKYTTLISYTMGGFWMGMNKQLWNSLPPDAQKVIDELTGETMSRQIGAALDSADRDDIKIMTEQGQIFYTMPPAERARVMDVIRPTLKDSWLERMAKTTVSAEESEELYKLYQKCATATQAEFTASK